MRQWQAPEQNMLPDFIICGAMKSGTTTLHAMLNQHPDVVIPEQEIHFFDADNLMQHPDFNTFHQQKWYKSKFSEANVDGWQWYKNQFNSTANKKLKGEDSTTYLASPLAIKRIAQQAKPIKLIIMLRQPSLRAYSNYWHLVRSGRVSLSFENLLQVAPQQVLNRSSYLQQLHTVFEHFPKSQVKVVIFEEFLANKSEVLEDICQFIGVEYNKLTAQVLTLHENAASYPKFYQLQLLKNKLFPLAGNLTYVDRLVTEEFERSFTRNFLRYINAIHRKINPLVDKKPKPLSANTKDFLDEFFKQELVGINELLDKNVMSLWFKS